MLVHTSKQSYIIKYIVIVLLSMSIYFPSVTLGAQTEVIHDATFWEQLTILLARLRIPLAMLAGKLLSNSFVYAEFINFDVYLWQLWNISKNIANLIVGLAFLYSILTFIFQPQKNTGSNVAKKLASFLLAGVLINASWFLMGALLDIEKITTSAMGSIPGIIIQQENQRGQKIIDALSNASINTYTLHLQEDSEGLLKLGLEEDPTVGTLEPEDMLDAILPRYDTLSGPLYFIGFAMFQFHKYGNVQLGNMNSLSDLSWLLSSVGIKLLIIGGFTVMMLMLFIVGLIRVVYLRIIIAFSPLIVVYIIATELLQINIGFGNDSLLSKIKLTTILTYIFQPTIIVTFMGTMLILTVGFWDGISSLQEGAFEEYGFNITNNSVEHSTFTVQTQGQVLPNIQDTDQGIFVHLLTILIVFGLLLGLLRLTASSLKVDFMKNTIQSLTRGLINIPLIPITTFATAGKKIAEDVTGIDLTTPGSVGKLDTKGEESVRKLLGLEKIRPSKKYLPILRQNISMPVEFFATLQEWKNEPEGISIATTPGLNQAIVDFIKYHEGKQIGNFGRLESIKAITGKETNQFDIADLPKYFSNANNRKIFYNAISGNSPQNTSNIPTDIINYRFASTK